MVLLLTGLNKQIWLWCKLYLRYYKNCLTKRTMQQMVQTFNLYTLNFLLYDKQNVNGKLPNCPNNLQLETYRITGHENSQNLH